MPDRIVKVANRLKVMPTRSPRALIAVAGPPASGKSTFAAQLVAHLNQSTHSAVLVPMDGFHLDNSVLARRGLLARKGAPPNVNQIANKVELAKFELRAVPPTLVVGAEPLEREKAHFIVSRGEDLYLKARAAAASPPLRVTAVCPPPPRRRRLLLALKLSTRAP